MGKVTSFNDQPDRYFDPLSIHVKVGILLKFVGIRDAQNLYLTYQLLFTISGSEYSDEFQQHSRAYMNAEGAKVSIRLEDVTVPISLCLLVMVAYIFGGALLFSQWEGWGYLDGSYFCFITLSTIGFGDMVPGDAIEDSTGRTKKECFHLKNLS